MENLETQKNLNFLFGWRVPLVMIFGGLGAGGPDWGGGNGVGGAMAGSQMGQGVGAWSARWQGWWGRRLMVGRSQVGQQDGGTGGPGGRGGGAGG